MAEDESTDLEHGGIGDDRSAETCSLSALLATSALIVACSSDAAGGSIEKCNSLAGSPYEPGNSSIGVDWDDIDTELAIPACRSALRDEASKENYFRLARALDKAESYGEAMDLYQKAADQGYALAQSSIGTLYGHGRGVTQDYTEALTSSGSARPLNRDLHRPKTRLECSTEMDSV